MRSRMVLLVTAAMAMMALVGCSKPDEAAGGAQVKVQAQTEENKQELKKMGEANARALANMNKSGAPPVRR